MLGGCRGLGASSLFSKMGFLGRPYRVGGIRISRRGYPPIFAKNRPQSPYLWGSMGSRGSKGRPYTKGVGTMHLKAPINRLLRTCFTFIQSEINHYILQDPRGRQIDFNISIVKNVNTIFVSTACTMLPKPPKHRVLYF